MLPLLVAAVESVHVESHYHHTWLIWALFYFGQLDHVALQIDTMSRAMSKKRIDILTSNGIRIFHRAVWCGVAFGIIWLYPQLIPGIAKLFGVTISSEEIGVVSIPMNNLIAIGAGLLFDSLLGYIPILKNQIPTLNGVNGE